MSALLRSETGYAVVKSQHFQVSALSASIRVEAGSLEEDLDSMPIHLLHSFPPEVS